MVKDAIDRESIRAELAATREAFHDLANQLTPDDWKRKTTNPAWHIGDLMYHLVASLELLPREVAHARKGKGLYNLPRFLLDPLNAWSTHLGARKETSATVIQRYDQAYATAIEVLDQVKANDWRLGAKFWSEGFLDIEGLFRSQTRHLAEHGPVIREALSRNSRSTHFEETSPQPQVAR